MYKLIKWKYKKYATDIVVSPQPKHLLIKKGIN